MQRLQGRRKPEYHGQGNARMSQPFNEQELATYQLA